MALQWHNTGQNGSKMVHSDPEMLQDGPGWAFDGHKMAFDGPGVIQICPIICTTWGPWEPLERFGPWESLEHKLPACCQLASTLLPSCCHPCSATIHAITLLTPC